MFSLSLPAFVDDTSAKEVSRVGFLLSSMCEITYNKSHLKTICAKYF